MESPRKATAGPSTPSAAADFAQDDTKDRDQVSGIRDQKCRSLGSSARGDFARDDTALSGVDGHDLAITQVPDVAHGRLAEEAAVLAVELADAFVADFIGGAGGIQPIHQHALSCGLEPELLLVLERTHCRQRAELMVECRNPHARDACELVDAKLPGVIGL